APSASAALNAAAPAPPSGLVVDDVPNDSGRSLTLRWNLSADDSAGAGRVAQYYVERARDPSGPRTMVDPDLARTGSYTHQAEHQTVAGLVILASVAKLTVKYETPIIVPVSYPIPFTIAEEMVKGAYLQAGKPDQYDPNSVRFISPEQFAYVAAVTGTMLRDR